MQAFKSDIRTRLGVAREKVNPLSDVGFSRNRERNFSGKCGFLSEFRWYRGLFVRPEIVGAIFYLNDNK